MIDKFNYKDPWCQDLNERLKNLSQGGFRVAYYYESANNSTFRYRAYNMVQVINESPASDIKCISASFFFENDLCRVDDIVKLADVLVICRSGINSNLSRLIERFKNKNKKIFFDIDDLVFDVRYASLVMNALGQDVYSNNVWDYWFSYMSRMGAVLLKCDEAITTNAFLANKIKEFHEVPVSIVPNFMNREQIEFSEIVRSKKKRNPPSDGVIKFGYFSGSPSHRLDYELVRNSINDLLSSNNNVKLIIAGYLDGDVVPNHLRDKVEFHQFRDYVNLQSLIGSVDYNLMPLQNNDFSNCKSELKYFEAAIVGVISLASPVHTYKNAILDGFNGFIVSGHQWGGILNSLVVDDSHYSIMAENAYRDAADKYSWINNYYLIKSLFLK